MQSDLMFSATSKKSASRTLAKTRISGDRIGVHAVGGTLGALLTGVLATGAVNSNLTDANPAAKMNGLAAAVARHALWIQQIKAICLTLVLAIAATTVIAYIVKALVGLRPAPDVERQGLDMIEHGEEGYID